MLRRCVSGGIWANKMDLYDNGSRCMNGGFLSSAVTNVYVSARGCIYLFTIILGRYTIQIKLYIILVVILIYLEVVIIGIGIMCIIQKLIHNHMEQHMV